MECLNELLRKLKNGLIIALILMICITPMPLFATEITDPPDGEGELPVSETTTLPHIDMKVKQVKVGDSTQVLVECWASKINNLEQIDIAFTYDNTVMEPSYISEDNKNAILDGLLDIEDDGEIVEKGIKSKNRPPKIEPSTAESIKEQEDFDIASTKVLSNSFAFANGYGSKLEIFKFLYLDQAEDKLNIETVKVTINLKEEETDGITSEEETLIGTFSFRKEGNEDLETQGGFSTVYIGITSENNEEGVDIRDITGGKNGNIDRNCEDLVKFEYEKYGSISGVIETGYFNNKGIYTSNNSRGQAKRTATIYLYKVEEGNEISKIDWNETGRNYAKSRQKIINYIPKTVSKYGTSCYIPDENATTQIPYVDKIKTKDGEHGAFSIENIEFGEYILFIDKYNYADYIITNITLNSTNKDINVGEIRLCAGDLNKDGMFVNQTDRSVMTNLKKLEKEVNDGTVNLEELGLEFPYDLNDDGKADLRTDRNIYTYAKKSLEEQIIKVVDDYAIRGENNE